MYSKTIILLVVTNICLQSLHSQVCSNPLNIIYGLDQKGNIVPINVNTASVGTTLTSSSDVGYPGSTTNSNAIGLNIQNSTFYFFQKNSASSQQFVSFNTITSKYTTLASSPISGSVVKGCISADGTGYYCIDATGALCYYNIAGNTWKKIGSNLVDQFNNNLSSVFTSLGSGDIAIDGLGNLWIVVSGASQWGLYELQGPLPTTAISTINLVEKIAPTQATPSGSPFGGIAYNATGQIYLSTTNDLYLLQNNLSITHSGTFSTSGVGADLTSCNYPFGILPVLFTGFGASLRSDNSVWLNWSVSNQLNIVRYNIERSKEPGTWENIGSGTGVSVGSAGTYTFSDPNPGGGTIFYRLQLLGNNGNVSYSEIKAVNISNNNNTSIWPIPAAGSINIQTPGNPTTMVGEVQIFNLSGRKVAGNLIHGGLNAIDINALAGGYYFVQVTLAKGDVINQKILKL